MNARSVRTLLSGNPIMQVFSLLAAGLAVIAAVLFGAVVLAFVLAFAFIVAIWFWIRVRWRLRGMRRAQQSQAQGARGGASRAERGRAGQGRIIEAESTVIEERDLRG